MMIGVLLVRLPIANFLISHQDNQSFFVVGIVGDYWYMHLDGIQTLTASA